MWLKLTQINQGFETPVLFNMNSFYQVTPTDKGSYLLMEGLIIIVKETVDEIYAMLEPTIDNTLLEAFGLTNV